MAAAERLSCHCLGACNADARQLTAVLHAAERLGINGCQVVPDGCMVLVFANPGLLRAQSLEGPDPT